MPWWWGTFVGEILKVGSNVNDFKPGDIVGGEGHVVCVRCRNCMAAPSSLRRYQRRGRQRPGLLPEYLSLPLTHRLGITRLDLDVASIFDPFGTAVHGARRPGAGRDVLITEAGQSASWPPRS
jgi:threonine 3-dehydrogenase